MRFRPGDPQFRKTIVLCCRLMICFGKLWENSIHCLLLFCVTTQWQCRQYKQNRQ